MKRIEVGDEIIYLNNDKYLQIYNLVKEKKYKIIKELKNDKRSLVLLIELEESESNSQKLELERVVLKVPREKNEKSWQRFLSMFRGSESKREFISCEMIKESGILGAEPIIAVEKVKSKIVKDSYFILSYIEGSHATFDNIELALKTLYKIHDLGHLHGDPQLPNFMIENEKVYLIDCKFSKVRFGDISKINEFIYFEKSCHRNVESKYKKMKIFPLLKKFDILKDEFNYFSKKIRGKAYKKGKK